MSDSTVEIQNSNVKLSYGTKFSYGLGDFASNISWGLVSSYLLYFYTDVFGLSAAVIGTLMLTARVWDAINDPIMGLIAERTKTRWGRFRPYILWGSIFLCIFNVLTFTVPDLQGNAKIAYAFVTYIMLGTIYTVVNLPYGALASVMTRDADERVSLNSFRGFFSLISSVVTGGAMIPLVKALGHGNDAKGFSSAALVLSAIALPIFFLVFFKCKEVITPPKHEKPSLRESLDAVITNKPFLLAITNLFFVFTGLFGRLGPVVYYYIYNMHRPDLIGPLMGLFGLSTALGAIIVAFLAKRFEKIYVSIFGMIISGLGLIAIFLTPATNIPMIVALTIISSIPLGFGTPIIFSIVGDCIDYHQLKTGKRADGAIYSVMSLVTKISMTLIGVLSVTALAAIGYVANQAQTPEAIKGINIVVNLVPGIFYLLSTIPFFFYKLKREETRRIAAELQKISKENEGR
jgi:sugar (Glycoside-Pentoside-Hexuronide) transporter